MESAARRAHRGIEIRPGDVLGRWRVLDSLGSGGMGIVYRAELEGQPYALKVVHPHLVERADLLRRFQREAEAGARVRHPRVARTYGVETAEVRGSPVHFLVMELVRGRTLMQVQEELGRLPDGLLRDIAAGVASGLDAIHAVGIVHRDLKPENVMLTERHEVKVMDLGIAWMANEEARLSRSGQLVGSLLFAAPEQLGDHPARLTPSADLYALGCMLHQLAVGRHALEDMPIAEVVNAHLRRPWPLISQSVPDASPFLDAVVSTLLEKEPKRRFPDARALREVLVAGEASPWWSARRNAARSTPVPAAAPGPAPAAAAPGAPVPAGLVGRARELRALAEEWRKARAGAGGAVLVPGAEGVGKTRLLTAFLDAEEAAPGTVRRAAAAEGAPPFGMTRALLKGLVPGGERAADLVALVPMDGPRAEALADVLRTGGASLAPGAVEAVAEDVAALAVALAARAPRLLAFDDLDRAGAGDRAVFLGAARRALRAPLLLMATVTAPVPAERRRELRGTGAVAEVPVQRLSDDDLRRVLLARTGLESTANAIAPRVIPHAGGLPRALERLVDAWRASGALVRGADGTLRPTGLPPPADADGGLRPVVARWVAQLDAVAREVLEAASVQGTRFDARIVADVLGHPALAVAEALGPLGSEPRLVVGEGRMRWFDPPLACDVVRASLEPAALADLHRRTAEAFAAAAASDDVPRAVACPRAAEHFLRAGAPDRAAPWIVPALDHLLAAGHGREGAALADLALAATGTAAPSLRCDVLARRAALLALEGRAEEERAALEDALAAHRAAGRDAPVALLDAYGRCLASQRDHRRAEAFFREVLASTRGGESSRAAAAAEGILARLALGRGDTKAARGHAERALLVARATGDGAREAAALGHVAAVLERQGRLDLAASHERARLARATPLGLSREVADAHAGLARLALRAGRWRDAQVHLDREAVTAEPVGYRRGVARARHGAGHVALARGRLAEARDHFLSALEVASGTATPADVAVAGLDLARVLAWLGDEERSRSELLCALAAAGRAGDPRALAAAHLVCGDAALDRGEAEEAARWYRDAMAAAGPAAVDETEAFARLGLAAAAVLRAGPARAAEDLDAAVAAAARAPVPGPRVLAAARRASAPGGDPAGALALLALHAGALSWRERVDVHVALARATGDPWHFGEAGRLLGAAREALTPSERTAFDATPLVRTVKGSGGLRCE